MNPLIKDLISIILLLALATISYAGTNTSCGGVGASGNFTANFSINASNHCVAGDWFNITSITSDTNLSKNISFAASNWSSSVHLVVNNTDNSTNYIVNIWNASVAGNISHNVTVLSNSTGVIEFNMTYLNNSGWVRFTRISSSPDSAYIYIVAFAVLVAGGAGIYLRRIKKV